MTFNEYLTTTNRKSERHHAFALWQLGLAQIDSCDAPTGLTNHLAVFNYVHSLNRGVEQMVHAVNLYQAFETRRHLKELKNSPEGKGKVGEKRIIKLKRALASLSKDMGSLLDTEEIIEQMKSDGIVAGDFCMFSDLLNHFDRLEKRDGPPLPL